MNKCKCKPRLLQETELLPKSIRSYEVYTVQHASYLARAFSKYADAVNKVLITDSTENIFWIVNFLNSKIWACIMLKGIWKLNLILHPTGTPIFALNVSTSCFYSVMKHRENISKLIMNW